MVIVSNNPRTKIKLPTGKKLLLLPIGDVQGEEQLHRLDRLIQWCVNQEKKGHTVRLILTGDYFETFSPSERVKRAGANFHETTLETIERGVRAQADDFATRLAPMKGRVIIVQQGHHWDNVKTKHGIISSDQYIANLLDAEYAGDGIAVIELWINGLVFRIMSMHGYGVGRAAGGRINKRLQMNQVVFNCHWYIHGHDNERMVVPREPLYVDGGVLKFMKQYYSGIGCYQESYHLGKLEAGYAEKVAYPPAVIGSVIGTITVEEQDGRKRLDYHVSA